MAFEDLTELIEPLELPIRGKTYRLPPVSIEGGLTLKSVLDGTPDPGVTDADVKRILLGDVLAQLEADAVPAEFIGRVMLTALADFRSGRFSAELMWRTGGDPKELDKLTQELAPNRAARRKTASTSSGGAGTTKRPASTNGTKTSRKKS